MVEDAELLRRYAELGSEEAFAELVRRRIGLVYSVALRQTRGNRHRAEDATQAVFTDLARKAGSLVGRPVLAGWLFRSTLARPNISREKPARRRATALQRSGSGSLGFNVLLAVLVLAGDASLLSQRQETSLLRTQLALTQIEVAELDRLRAENQQLREKQIAPQVLETLRADHAALPRLRAPGGVAERSG